MLLHFYFTEGLEEKFNKRFEGTLNKYADKDHLKDEQIRVLIQTVNDHEFRAVMIEMKEGSPVKKYEINDPVCGSKSYYYVGKWGDGEIPVAIIQTGMGTNGAYGSWYETKKALYNLPHLKYIFAVGVCGGIQGEVKMGDVVVSEYIWGYSKLKMAEPWWTRSHYVPLHDNNFFHYLKQAAHRPPGTVIKFGTIMSGPWLIKSTDIQKKLLEICPEAKAFEMEGDGIVNACQGKSVEYLIVKGVCDFGDQHKNDDWQPQAATNAAKSLCKAMTYAPADFCRW